MTEAQIAAIAALLLGLILGALIASLRARKRSEALHVEVAVLKAQVRTEQQLERERQESLDRAAERLKSAFDTVAGQSLRANSDVFLKLAREHLGQHQESATALQKETRTLVNALRRPEVRGQWGEMTLRRLAELAGMVDRCDFSEQVHVRSEDGNLRPDMIVHMPDGRDLVVDVKTPLDAYLEAVEATTDELRAVALRRHAQAVCDRLKQLSAKNYWSQFEKSPDFVVLFIPGDQFLSAALAEMPTLLEDGIRQNVIIATPTSFVALLKAVAYGWRQTALAQNAETIRSLAEDLYKRLSVFSGHLVRLGRSLGMSVDAFNSAIGSLERQVLPGARKFTELGIRPDKEIENLDPIATLARDPQLLERNGEAPPGPATDKLS